MRHTLSVIGVALALMSSPGAHGVQNTHELLLERIEWLMFQTELAIRGEPILARLMLPELYAANDYRPLWQSRSAIEQLNELAQYAWRQGLDPDDYPLKALNLLLPAVGLPVDASTRTDLDILATETLLRIGYQLRFGKVNPRHFYPNWNFDRPLVAGEDPVAAVLEIIAAERLEASLTRAIARGPLYENLVRVLAELRAASDRGGWPRVPDGPTLRPGDMDPRVPLLRARLTASGDLPQDGGTTLYDLDMAAGVERFQARHGLVEDGVVGVRTTEALNVPVAARIDQVRLSLERGRWVFNDTALSDGRIVLVNIAAAEVSLLEGGDRIWQARAQVGKPYRQTPVFKDQIEYLIFNPTWTVPPTVLREDLLPQLTAAPAAFLAAQHMDLLDREGRPIGVADVDWSSVRAAEIPINLRQRPGPWNALGRVKFMFPNPYLVFLHDTPSRDLFTRADRTFSSGCVRIAEPFQLAELLLDDPERWNQAAFDAVFADGKPMTVHLRRPVPIFLMYLTADADTQGRVRFFDDVYNRDDTLLEALDAEPVFDTDVSQLRR